jgi:hypothetical protein
MADSVTEQIVREAPEIEAYKLGLLQSAKAIPMPELPAYQIAGMSPTQQAALTSGRAGIGAYKPYMTQASNVYNAGQNMLNQSHGSFDAAAANQYMNPYNQQVINQAMMNINRQGDIANQNLQSQAIRSGAFGGSREGVQRAELQRGLAETRNATMTNLLNQGYDTAQKAFEAERARNLSGAQLSDLLGRGIGSLGAQTQALGQQDVNFQFSLGSQEQKQQQAELDALRSSNMARAMQPYQHLGFLSDIYKGAPSTQMSVANMSQPAPSPFQQIAGLVTGIGSTYGAAKTAGIL